MSFLVLSGGKLVDAVNDLKLFPFFPKLPEKSPPFCDFVELPRKAETTDAENSRALPETIERDLSTAETILI